MFGFWNGFGNCKVGAPQLITKCSSCGAILSFTIGSKWESGTRLYVRGSKGLWVFMVHDPIILIKTPPNAPKYI